MASTTDLFAAWQDRERAATAARQQYKTAVETGSSDCEAYRLAGEEAAQLAQLALRAYLDALTEANRSSSWRAAN